jgi:hypothetical protein
MMEAVRTSETSVDNHFTRQYNPEDSSEQKPVNLDKFLWKSLISNFMNIRSAVLEFFHADRKPDR